LKKGRTKLRGVRKNERGVLLIASLGLITSLSLLAMTLMTGSVVQMRQAQRAENQLIAFHLADGAIDQTMVALRTDLNFAGVPSTANSLGNYRTVVCSARNPNNCADPTNPPAANNYYIRATGQVGNTATDFGFAQRQVNAVATFPQGALFDFAIFADQSITISGNAGTDSYNSTNGPYNPLTKGSHGDVGSNAGTAHTVQMSGNAVINGSVLGGPGANPANFVTMSGNTLITGSISAATAKKTLPPVNIAPQTCSDLTVNANNTVTLPAGNYCYKSINVSGNGVLNFSGAAKLTATNDISISGNGKVNFSAATDVYVKGSVSISGNGVGTAQNRPPNLKLFVQGASVSISGNGNFYGAVYAPTAAFSHSGNGQLFGAVVSRSVSDSGNAAIHYDEALNESGETTATNRLLAWQEAGIV
jgi:Tfp pilus assembly protein PilX